MDRHSRLSRRSTFKYRFPNLPYGEIFDCADFTLKFRHWMALVGLLDDPLFSPDWTYDVAYRDRRISLYFADGKTAMLFKLTWL